MIDAMIDVLIDGVNNNFTIFLSLCSFSFIFKVDQDKISKQQRTKSWHTRKWGRMKQLRMYNDKTVIKTKFFPLLT